MEVGALPVLHDLVDEDVFDFGPLHPAGKLAQADFLRRLVAPFAGDDVVDVQVRDEADRHGLDDAELPHRCDEFLLAFRIERFSGLLGIRSDVFEFDEEGAGESALFR